MIEPQTQLDMVKMFISQLNLEINNHEVRMKQLITDRAFWYAVFERLNKKKK